MRQIAKLKSLLSFKDLEIVIHAFISSRLDYCNALHMCHMCQACSWFKMQPQGC